MTMFETASRLKLRFDSPVGKLSTEDLWDLPLKAGTNRGANANLDDVAKTLYRHLKETADVASFVDDAVPADTRLQLAFDVVKHVIDVKKTEAEVAATARAKAEKKQQLLGLIAQKEFEGLASASIDDLKAQVAAL